MTSSNNKKKKILLLAINHAPEQTGIGKYQGETASWLEQKGYDVRVVTAPPYYPAWQITDGYKNSYHTEMIDGVKTYRTPIYVPAKPSGLKRLIHLASFAFSSLPVLMWQAISWRPDAVIATAPPLMAAPFALLASKIAGAKSHLRVQDFEVDAAFDLGLLNNTSCAQRIALSIESLILRGFDSVNTISPRMCDKLLEKGVKEKNTALIPNWAGVDDFDPKQGAGKWHDLLKQDPETVLAVYSGNLGRKQGLETIIEAAKILKGNKTIRFVISGQGSARAEIEQQSQTMDNVTLLPIQPMNEFIHLMIAADIHLLPQRAEAADLVMPSKLGNILASARPVVVGANEGTQLFDAIQECGLAVPPDDPRSFANAIVELAKDKERRHQMGAEGLKRAHQDWSQNGIMEKFEKILFKNKA